MSLTESIKQEMAENAAMQAYFKQFSEFSVSTFIDSYATYKSIWLNHGQRLMANEENDHIQWINEASEHLKIIQQKKLFDAQCLWRAEQLQIPEVQICYDFELWEKNVLNCPFISPVDESDIELYTQYLLTHYNSEELDIRYHNSESWQNHAEIIEAYKTDNENRNFPDWYEFYNSRRNTGVYMTLPDIRGEKEAFYVDIARTYNKSQVADNTPDEPYVSLPFISYFNKEQRDWFVQTFENKEVQKYYHAYEWSERNSDVKDALVTYLDVLYEANEPVAIEANQNWHEAIKIAAQKYACTKIAEALPHAWEEYMINIQMNIAFPNDIDPDDVWHSIRKMYIEGILHGRRINNEPEDLDF